MYLITPGGGLGSAAVQAAGTAEQKAKFLARFNEDKPTFAAMCMTEPQAGRIPRRFELGQFWTKRRTTWVITGEKIFVTAGEKSFNEHPEFGKGFLVVWASIDPTAGRAGMRSFVIEAGTPGER